MLALGLRLRSLNGYPRGVGDRQGSVLAPGVDSAAAAAAGFRFWSAGVWGLGGVTY